MSARDRYSQSYSPADDDFDTFDAREDGHGRRGPILLLAAAVVLVLFLGVVWSAYNLGVRERNTAPILTADSQPWRVAPTDPGGVETPGQDIEAYRLREREQARVETAEIDATVRPGPEEPVSAPERPPLTVETEDTDRLERPRGSEPADEPETAPEPAPEPARERETEPVQRAEAPAEQPAASRPAPAASASGNFVVQIAAFRTIEEAEEAWIAFIARFPDLAGGRSPSIVEANLGARGIYHRLRIAGFETRDEASRYCQTLSSRGQDCLVAAR
ncbi:MAG: SPOR domain-containing protein [Oceanicaulis sp.]|uniref:SPOR domain-containing protein n=1 Tax=Glycocaulis sp. TaxID=1969725 RepID=UPI0025C70885|nr:SPOR domain-containing protein [Glycocaulis sp.]MCC5982125.1 SPOR domain-containing protein [Oceanicaulis sp.]MCH8522098.1 SPOR domain-containing protein [Glycocaulis sp.]